MFKRLSIIALSAPALLLAGCAGTTPQYRGLETAHQPVVTRTDFVFDMTTEDGRVPSSELQRLADWLSTLHLGYGDKVAFDDPAGASSMARRDVAAVVARYGLFLADTVPVSATPAAPGTVRVTISRTTAEVPGCPDTHDTGNFNFNSHTSSNYGCATSSNLAAMIAQPEDFVRGQRGSTTSDPATGTRAIQSLRRGTGSGGSGTTSAGGTSGGASSSSSSSGGSGK